MNKFLKFPEGFLWGGASAPEQIEGHGNTGKGKTNWDVYFERSPEAFHNGVGPDVTSDFFNHYKDDLELFTSFGAKSIRLGVSWARILPDGKNVSEAGLKFYHDVLDKADELGMQIVLNIFHFDMPWWAQQLGGWESNEVINKYAEFCELVYKEFGNRVKWIATMNEPNIVIFNGYMNETHMPLLVDNKRGVQAGYGTVLAHAKAVNIFNEKYKGKVKAQIGVISSTNPAIAKDGKTATPADEQAAREYDLLHNWAMMWPMVKGEFHPDLMPFLKKHDLVPNYTEEEIAEIRKVKVDFIGTNYYAPNRVVAPTNPNPRHIFEAIADHYHLEDGRYNVFRGWEIRPETMYDLAMIIKRDFDNIPFFVSENGMGVQNEWNFRGENGEIQDDYRIAFLQEHLEELHRAIEDGANCFGYHMWAITDNWSWRNAYKNTYGFVEIDLKTQERRLKKSARWLKGVSEANGFETGFKKIEDVIDLTKVEYEASIK